MKRFLVQFALFLLPIMVSAYFIDSFLSSNLKKSVSYTREYEVWNDIIDGKINADIIINGSSRAWVHINPVTLEKSLDGTAYNIGIDGHNFGLQYLRHSLLLKHNRKPKLVIHSLDIFTLAKRKDLFNADQFLPYMLWNKEIKTATESYIGYNFLEYSTPLMRYYGKSGAIRTAITMFCQPDQGIFRQKGYCGQPLPWNTEFDQAKSKMTSYEAKLDTSTIAFFEKYLIECRDNNIKIVFVYTPEYIEGQQFVSNRNKIMGIYAGLSKKYSIPFFDYSKDSICFQKKYFYNALHMNLEGAELFTSKLAGDLKNSNIGAILK